MIITCINNRTENWKTAKAFIPLTNGGLQRLARQLGKDDTSPNNKLHMQLFWKGMRDLHHKRPEFCTQQKVADRFDHHFRNLHNEVNEFRNRDGRKFKKLNNCNYVTDTEEQRRRLLSNLLHTEIDIVIESPDRLFIGEAKFEMGFGASAKLILVHQIIRQYVMARILLDIMDAPEKKVIPFVVGDSVSSLQMNFMIEKRWLDRSNILAWKDIANLLK